MKRLTIALSILLGSSFLAEPLFAQNNQLYRWVDDQGKVHFGDRLDAGHGTRSLDRFNAQGVRLSQASGKISPDEQRKLDEMRRTAYRDNALLSGYQSELELLKAHDEQRTVMEFSLRTNQNNIARLRREISERPEPINGGSDQVLMRLKAQLEAEEQSLQQLQQRRFDLYESQNGELARYRELSRDQDDDVALAPSA